MEKTYKNSDKQGKSRAVANNSSQRKKDGKTTLAFVDNRSEEIDKKEQMEGAEGGAVQQKGNEGTNSTIAANRPQASAKACCQPMTRGSGIIQMMSKDDWLAKAKKLHQACCQEQANKKRRRTLKRQRGCNA